MKHRIFFFLGLALCACEKPLELELPYEGKKLVAACLLSPEAEVSALITRSLPPGGPDTGRWEVADALVVLEQIGDFSDTLRYDADAGAYLPASPWRPQAGKRYRLQVSAAGFPLAYSDTVRMPFPLPIDSWTFRDSARESINSDEALGEVYVRVSPLLSQGAYYYVGVESYVDGGRRFALSGCLGGDLAASCFTSANGTDSECIFPESCLLRTPASLGLWASTSGRPQDMPFEPPRRFDSLVVRVRSLHPSLYLYYETRYQPSGFELAFSDPASIHSNLRGGYGLLGAYSESKLVIPLR
jgi:hypothetical protein